jgi:hypothetical protein
MTEAEHIAHAAQMESAAMAAREDRLLQREEQLLEALSTMANFVCIAMGHMPDEERIGYGNPRKMAQWHFNFVMDILTKAKGAAQ